MLTVPRDHFTVDRLQELVHVIFMARDELYAAADSLADQDKRYICRWLGDRLGGHAADLQQIISATGAPPMGPDARHDFGEGLPTIRPQLDDRIGLDVAEHMEKVLTERYDVAIASLADPDVASLLGRQREECAFADCVLRSLKATV